MPFFPGDRVIVLPLGRKPGTVVHLGRGGRYRVQVENTTVSCREHDLAPPVPSKPQREARAAEARGKNRPRPETSSRAAPEAASAPTIDRVDLHGLTIEEALARVVDAIDAALRRGADRLEVVHGKGSGRIRAALHPYLGTMPVVAAFNLDPRNEGVTWVYF